MPDGALADVPVLSKAEHNAHGFEFSDESWPGGPRARQSERARSPGPASRHGHKLAVADGVRMTDAARVLDVDNETLRKWLRNASTITTALVPVVVVADEPTPTCARLVSPARFRVEGLALDEMVALLRLLG